MRRSKYVPVGFAHPRADEPIDTLNVLVDGEAALLLWREYQRLIAEESPYTVLYYPERLNGVRTRLRGAVFDVRGEFTTAPQWWLHPSERRGAGGGRRGQRPAPGSARRIRGRGRPVASGALRDRLRLGLLLRPLIG